MDTADIVKLLGTGGIASAVLLILARVVMKVADRMIASIDKIGERIESHSRADLESHGEFGERLSRLEGKLDESLNWTRSTPVEEMPARANTPARGTYHFQGKDTKR